jgi:hypothetical protein
MRKICPTSITIAVHDKFADVSRIVDKENNLIHCVKDKIIF